MITCTFENGSQNSLRHITVDCLVLKDSKVLLEKRSASLVEGGKWCLVGGYIERDETIEAGCAREALEETGWEIGNFTLLRIDDNPNRTTDDFQNVSFVFVADALRRTGQKDWESEKVEWFPLDQLPPEEQMAFDHHYNIELYKRHVEEPLALPVMGRLQP